MTSRILRADAGAGQIFSCSRVWGLAGAGVVLDTVTHLWIVRIRILGLWLMVGLFEGLGRWRWEVVLVRIYAGIRIRTFGTILVMLVSM